MENEKGPYSWWWESHNCPQNSPWLQFTLSDLDHHTKAMLTLIQADGDSFAQRAEMYYRRRPELVKMVEEFHRSYRSLAERYDQLTERYDQLKSESGHTHSLSSSSPNSLKQLQSPHNTCRKAMGSSVDSKLESPDSNPESVVEDPDLECITHISHFHLLQNKTTDGLKKGQPTNLNLIGDHQIQNSGKPDLEIGINAMETEVVGQKSTGFELGHETVNNYDAGNLLDRESLDCNPESVNEDPNIECDTHILHLDLPNETTDDFLKGQPPNLNLIDDHQIQNSGKLDLEIGINLMETEVVEQKNNGFELGHETVENYVAGDFLEKESMCTELRFQVSRLMEENLKLKAELIRLNDEKREAIEELCTLLETLVEENWSLQKCVRDSKVYKKQNTAQILRFKGRFKWLGGCSACVGGSNVYNKQNTSKIMRFKGRFKCLAGGSA